MCFFFFFFVESQSHRTSWVGSNLKDHLVPAPLLSAGMPPTTSHCPRPCLTCPGPHPISLALPFAHSKDHGASPYNEWSWGLYSQAGDVGLNAFEWKKGNPALLHSQWVKRET